MKRTQYYFCNVFHSLLLRCPKGSKKKKKKNIRERIYHPHTKHTIGGTCFSLSFS